MKPLFFYFDTDIEANETRHRRFSDKRIDREKQVTVPGNTRFPSHMINGNEDGTLSGLESLGLGDRLKPVPAPRNKASMTLVDGVLQSNLTIILE